MDVDDAEGHTADEYIRLAHCWNKMSMASYAAQTRLETAAKDKAVDRVEEMLFDSAGLGEAVGSCCCDERHFIDSLRLGCSGESVSEEEHALEIRRGREDSKSFHEVDDAKRRRLLL